MSSLEDENVAALASLRSSFGGLQVAPRRGMSLCPHCHEAFGSASLSIHTRRCRMLYQYDNQDDGQNAQEKKNPMKIKPVKKLIDLCLQEIVANFHVTCMEKIYTQPEHQAALLDSLPPNLVHRIVINLVVEGRELKAKENKQRSKAQELQRQLENSQQRASQLVLARRQAARLTTRINEHEYQLQTLRTNFQALQNEKNAIVAEKNQFEAQANIWKKTKQRMETKMNALLNENEQLKSQLKQAQKKEMTAVKSLALVARASSGAMARKTTEENDAGIPNASGMCGPPPTPVSLIEGSNSSTPGNGSAELQSQFPDEEIKDQPHCKRLRSTTSSYSATKTTTDTVRSKIPRPTLRRPVPSSRITSTSRTATGCANNK